MQWKGRRESDNVEDRRSSSTPRRLAIGGGGSIVLVILYLILGGDPRNLLQQGGGGGGGPGGMPFDVSQPAGEQETNPAEEEAASFIRVVVADTEDVWSRLFEAEGRTYTNPKLVLFRREVDSACGSASAAMGPFYCPGDQQVYLDLGFFEELKRRFSSPGDFAEAYVVAHEVGHHVQKLLGINSQVHERQSQVSKAEANRLSVRLELQADFLAGVWAHHIQQQKHVLDPGDIDEALNAANAIGDDTLQRQARGRVVPDSFTHGTSEQRNRWFREGFQTGDFSRRKALFESNYEDL
jgi:predicted metalloprotease